jgi:ATP phosphoribosyltransferase
MSQKELKIGIPKGSLQEATVQIFEKAGFRLSCSSRSYFPTIDDVEIKPVLIRAQEMARYVEEGILDCGITGNDWVLEYAAKVERLATLEYSKATSNPVRWVVAVDNDSPYKTIKDLKGKRISTELVGATKRYFKKNGVPVKVEFSWGATEVKVKADLADAIVELTETGSSLKANNLRIIDTVCESKTQFIASKAASKDAWKRKKMDYVVMLLLGAIEARGKVGVKLNVQEKNLEKVVSVLPSLRKPTIAHLIDKGWFALEFIAEEREIKSLIAKLKDFGAEGIVEYPLNKIIH